MGDSGRNGTTMRLLEDEAKARLSVGGVRVPEAAVADTPDSALSAAFALDSEVFVKALVPANRRKRNRGVVGPVDADGAAAAARNLLGSRVLGHRCRRVYVEEATPIAEELYLGFSWGAEGPLAVASPAGGVAIEESDDGPACLAVEQPLTSGEAADLWRRALGGAVPPSGLVSLTAAASAVFFDDALLVEINPVAVQPDGEVTAVGGLIEMDDNALFRHPELRWRAHQLTEREQAVAEADRRLPGPSVRYTELGGDTGLLVGGGGAGLYQHDLLVAAGVSPANHSDLGAGVSAEKLDALIDAVLGHPNLSRLLVGFNTLQMAPCDLIVERLLAGLDRSGHSRGSLPVVIRLEGLNAERSRSLASGRPGLTYLPPGASLGDAVDTLMRLSRCS